MARRAGSVLRMKRSGGLGAQGHSTIIFALMKYTERFNDEVGIDMEGSDIYKYSAHAVDSANCGR